jgi:hypothetical protein
VQQKLDHRGTFLIGFGFFGISVMWALYNTHVPIFLQAACSTLSSGRCPSGPVARPRSLLRQILLWKIREPQDLVDPLVTEKVWTSSAV